MTLLEQVEEALDRLESAQTPEETLNASRELLLVAHRVQEDAVIAALPILSYRRIGQILGDITGETVRQRYIVKRAPYASNSRILPNRRAI